MWEYTYVKFQANGVPEMADELNQLGLVGWEVCGFAFVDQTLGLNQIVALLKRPKPVAVEPPSDLAPAWHPDPYARHTHRYWDGLRWTADVSDDGERAIDFPGVR